MPDNIELVALESQTHWDAYHDIRRRILFEARGQYGVYDERHPDEFDPNNHPKILLCDGLVVGAVRIDLTERHAILRRVAIDAPFQGMGYGRQLIERSEQFILSRGIKEVLSSVASESVGFYQKCGYILVGNEPENGGGGSVLMRKDLAGT